MIDFAFFKCGSDLDLIPCITLIDLIYNLNISEV